MSIWEYCIMTAMETSKISTFTISYASRVEKPPVNGRLSVLTEMGRNGWELVAVHPLAREMNEFYFKRRVDG